MIILTGELNLENGSNQINMVTTDEKIIVTAKNWGSLSSCIALYKNHKEGNSLQFFAKEIAQEIHVQVGDKTAVVLKEAKIKALNLFTLPRLAIAYLFA